MFRNKSWLTLQRNCPSLLELNLEVSCPVKEFIFPPGKDMISYGIIHLCAESQSHRGNKAGTLATVSLLAGNLCALKASRLRQLALRVLLSIPIQSNQPMYPFH